MHIKAQKSSDTIMKFIVMMIEDEESA